MKTITNDFKNEIKKLGREIDFKFFLHTNDKILAEDGNFLMTESNQHLVVEQFDDTEVDEIITAEEIYNVNIVTCGNILSTMMKELDFEVGKDLRIGDVIDCEFGLKVNDAYEYINYGSYMVYSKEYNEDTQTYNYVAYDRMMLTMQEADATFLDSIEDETIADDISTICSTVGLTYTASQEELETYPNLSKEINDGTFTDLQITYRDILDMMCQALGLSMIVEDKQLILKPLDRTIKDTINEQYLKDTNAIFSKKYGPINSVVLSRSEGNDNIYVRDEESISNYGLCEFKIKDNPILLYNDREDYIDEIFDQLNGLEYYPNDFSSTGITYLDWLDFYNVTIGNKVYKCLMLNDEIKIEQGLEESIYSEEPEETTTPYKTSSKTDKEVSFIVDKQNGNIRAKVSKGEVINEINLDESGVEINADKINLNGAVTANSNFKILQDGSMEAVNGKFSGKITTEEGKIGGFTIGEKSLSANIQDKYTYTLDDAQRLRNILMGTITPTQQDYEKLDVNHDGILNSQDLVFILQKYYGYMSTEGTITLTIDDANRVLYFTGNGTGGFPETNISMHFITTTGLTAQWVDAETIQGETIQGGNIDSGSGVCSSSGAEHINFNKIFTSTPHVVATPETTTNGVIALKITNITTTGFDITVGGSGFSNIVFNWIAIL